MNKDSERTILAGHYEGSLDFRKGQGKDEITAMEPALRGPGNAAETADGIVATTPEPDDENVRRCDHCGKPMKEGYYLGGEFACSDECALALYHGDKAQMDEDLSHADEADGECYWTEWDSVYFD